MKKLFLLVILLTAFVPGYTATAENTLYFRAMKDEMTRTLKELHVPGELKPYYVAYFVKQKKWWNRTYSLGVFDASSDEQPTDNLEVNVVLDIGSDSNNSSGFFAEGYRAPYSQLGEEAAKSYEGLRQALWRVSNHRYLQAIERYKQKQAYKRKKNMENKLPDVVPAKQGIFIREVPAWPVPPKQRLDAWLQQMSSLGKKEPFLEEFSVSAVQAQEDRYFLNSRGGKSQTSVVTYRISLNAAFRQPSGYRETPYKGIFLKDFSEESLASAEAEIHEFLVSLHARYAAAEPEPYLGPVLYKPAAAAGVLDSRLLKALSNTAPFLVEDNDEDDSASSWRKKLGRRMMSPHITVYDRPQVESYEGMALERTYYIDAEGVPSQELILVSNGRLQMLPFSQRPTGKKHASNGHAFVYHGDTTREKVSNVFVEPQTTWTDEEMEEKLLARCRELDLAYCYIKHEDEDTAYERIYTQDGHREYVSALRVENESARVLRDILAAGGEPALIKRRMVTPSLLIDEVELVPVDRKPERKPFIAKPQ